MYVNSPKKGKGANRQTSSGGSKHENFIGELHFHRK
jgi:hypothetical protein